MSTLAAQRRAKAAYKRRHWTKVLAGDALRRRRKYANDPVYRERVLRRAKARYAANPKKIAPTIASMEKNREKARAWRAGFKERDLVGYRLHWRIVQQNRRVARAGGKVSQEEWDAVLRAYDHRCAYCGGPGPLAMDHYIALASGGPHVAQNIVPACKTCNSRKRDRHPVEFRKRPAVFLEA